MGWVWFCGGVERCQPMAQSVGLATPECEPAQRIFLCARGPGGMKKLRGTRSRRCAHPLRVAPPPELASRRGAQHFCRVARGVAPRSGQSHRAANPRHPGRPRQRPAAGACQFSEAVRFLQSRCAGPNAKHHTPNLKHQDRARHHLPFRCPNSAAPC